MCGNLLFVPVVWPQVHVHDLLDDFHHLLEVVAGQGEAFSIQMYRNLYAGNNYLQFHSITSLTETILNLVRGRNVCDSRY